MPISFLVHLVHWFPTIIGLGSLLVAIYSVIKIESWKRRVKISLNILVDRSHALTKYAEDNNLPIEIKEQISGLNHEMTFVLSIFKEQAQKWVKVNKPEHEWPLWEQKLEISMNKYRK